jgi:hypothetical protein
MTIATKNGSLIVKDGKLAENCGCCGCPPCTPTSVTVSVSASSFLRHVLLRNIPFPTNEAKWSQLYVAASGIFNLTNIGGTWQSEELPIIGGGRITARFYSVGVLREMELKIPMTTLSAFRPQGGSLPFEFLSTAELTAGYVSNTPANQLLASGFIGATFRCAAEGNADTYKSVRFGLGGIGMWVGDGLVPPVEVCDFLTFQSFFSDSRLAQKGTPTYLQSGYNYQIVGDDRSGSNLVTLDSVDFTCCENETGTEGACCEGTTCSVKPQCQCQGAGQRFRGVGTTCTPNPCLCATGRCCGPDVVPGYPGYYQCREISASMGFATFEDRLAECNRIGGDYTECGRCFSGERGDPQSCRINPLP